MRETPPLHLLNIMYNLVIIGSGNLATHLTLALHTSGMNIMQVYSPTASHASQLADRVGAEPVSSLSLISRDADAYIISIKDDAISSVLSALSPFPPASVVIHTAGSVPIDILMPHTPHAAVLYPMQTFTKGREVDFSIIPCFVESSDALSAHVVHALASSVSTRVVTLSSERRRRLHLAAVFACNLTNHCYRLAERVMSSAGLDFSLLQPLIDETARKVTSLSPRDAQTGPMVRNDHTVMDRQMALIDDNLTREIYRLMAESIYRDSSGR